MTYPRLADVIAKDGEMERLRGVALKSTYLGVDISQMTSTELYSLIGALIEDVRAAVAAMELMEQEELDCQWSN